MIERIGPYRYYPDSEEQIDEIRNTIVNNMLNKQEIAFYQSDIRGIQESDYEQIRKQCGIYIQDLPDARPEISAIMYNEDGIINALIISGIKSLKDEYGPNPDEYGGEKFYWSESREILAAYINPDYIIDFLEIDQLRHRVNAMEKYYVRSLWCKANVLDEDIAEILGFDSNYIHNSKYFRVNVSSGSGLYEYKDT